MYFSARHIDIKLNQDYSDFSEDALIICDGIGEFKDSGIVAKRVTELMIDKAYDSIDSLIIDPQIEKIKKEIACGGTTILFAKKKRLNNCVGIEYLGNGGIIHLQGSFANNVNVDIPYRYSEIMLPHITPKGELDKHLSHNSTIEDYEPTKLTLSLNQKSGDIILFFTDGISSIEDKVILKDDENRFWRYESSAIQLILSELDVFLKKGNSEDFSEKIPQFLDDTLKKLKGNKMLEDDASIGIILTKQVLNYYKSVSDD